MVKVIHLQTCRSFWLKNTHDFNKFTASICCSSFSLCLLVDTVHRYLVILPKAMPRHLPKLPVGQFLLYFPERQKMYPQRKWLQLVPASSTGTKGRVQTHKWQHSALPGRTSQTSGKISRKLLRNHQETNSGHVRKEVIIALFLGVCYKFDLHKLKLLQLSYFPNNYNLISWNYN